MNDYGDALISIRPRFAEAILSGQKTVEVRRRIPRIALGTRLWIYATRPTAAVIGSVVVERVFHTAPTRLWEMLGHAMCLDRCEYDEYFHGSDVAVGLLLKEALRATRIEIGELRTLRAGFHPPQVIARLTREEARSLYSLSYSVAT